MRPDNGRWELPPADLSFSSAEIHVWRVSLAPTGARLRSLRPLLDADERRRADSFCFETDRDHFVIARGVLRVLLGRYLNREPSALRFSYGSHGKPALADKPGREALRFNVSHSHGLALVAVTLGREIGVDLEWIRADLDLEGIAKRFFSPGEVAMLRALAPNVQTEAFFACWTRKEAYIKARGEGLSLPLDQFDVSLVPGEPAVRLTIRGAPSEASRWSLRELAPEAGYAAAVAAEGHGGRLACWDLAGVGA
jgi:4'-phosphopantetheinyl transferase